jgi:hypothetical protein
VLLLEHKKFIPPILKLALIGGSTVKFKLATALFLTSLCAGPAFCTTISFAGGGNSLGHSHTYGSGSTTVTAYAFGGTGNLYGKGTSGSFGSEDGLGISRELDNEIAGTTFVQLDLTNITNPFSLSIGSTQNVEGFELCFSGTLGTEGSACTNYPDPGADPFSTPFLTKGARYVSIEALGDGNVLVSGLTTAPIPEPSSLLLLGTGIVGAAGLIRRKFAA